MWSQTAWDQGMGSSPSIIRRKFATGVRLMLATALWDGLVMV